MSSSLTLCEACNGTGRRGLLGEVRAYKTCAACDGSGKVVAGEAVIEEKPPVLLDPRVKHTPAEGKRRRKHGGAR
ncbi:MAG: hypothetical protein H0U60_20230 [Blastocatellia bacterium]|nr:hypothetical protein [Blastocatellia bacterium]